MTVWEAIQACRRQGLVVLEPRNEPGVVLIIGIALNPMAAHEPITVIAAHEAEACALLAAETVAREAAKALLDRPGRDSLQ